jgi:hypothetical protein
MKSLVCGNEFYHVIGSASLFQILTFWIVVCRMHCADAAVCFAVDSNNELHSFFFLLHFGNWLIATYSGGAISPEQIL